MPSVVSSLSIHVVANIISNMHVCVHQYTRDKLTGHTYYDKRHTHINYYNNPCNQTSPKTVNTKSSCNILKMQGNA